MTDINATLKTAAVGDIVLYTLNKNDCDTILQNRQSAGQGTKRGNVPRPGDVLPAMIVRWNGDETSNPHASVNIQVILDGDDTLWAPSRSRFDPKVHGRHAGYDDVEEGWLPDPRGHWVAR